MIGPYIKAVKEAEETPRCPGCGGPLWRVPPKAPEWHCTPCKRIFR